MAHCSSISDRMYNFQNTGTSDPSFDPTFLATLKKSCPQGNPDASATVALDQQSQSTFDNQVYSDETKGRGVLAIDEAIFTSSVTNGTLNQMANNQALFFKSFTAALIKLGLVGVKDSTTGNIRSDCSVVGTSPANSPAPSPDGSVGAGPAFSPSGFDLSDADAPPPTSGG